MFARGYILDNWHFPDAEFQQIIEGMRRLKPARDELATASAANNIASMQEIDEAVLQLVKDCGKQLANTIRINNHVPPPGSGVPCAHVIVRPMLLPLNAPPQCQWSMATAVVPNAGPADPEAQNDSPPPGAANPQSRIGLRLRNLYWQKDAHQPANIPGQIQSGPSMGILGRPLGIKHALANPPGLINLSGPEDIPVQIQFVSLNWHSGYATGYQTCSSESPRSDQSARPRRSTCANPSGSPNGYSREANGDATCSSGGYPRSSSTERGGPVDTILGSGTEGASRSVRSVPN